MALLRYVGPIDEVYVRDAGVYAKRDGDPVEIADPGVVASLLAQETFVEAAPEKAPAKTNPAKEA